MKFPVQPEFTSALDGEVRGPREYRATCLGIQRGGKRGPTGSGQRGGVDIPAGCRQGQCGKCKRPLLDGRVEMTCENGLDPESKARGYVLTCAGGAAANVRLDA